MFQDYCTNLEQNKPVDTSDEDSEGESSDEDVTEPEWMVVGTSE